ETGEIAAVLQDSLSGEVVPIELLYIFILGGDVVDVMGVCAGFCLPNQRVLRNRAVLRTSPIG
ncbi:hypothetical protein ABEX25_09515, partial [Paenibacillus thiaminolyticus]|uniref:hypothetical protein n=1 Tax=Paenibacillus thiaminolyticus TaxID=49283 RepID=UPI003D2B063D